MDFIFKNSNSGNNQSDEQPLFGGGDKANDNEGFKFKFSSNNKEPSKGVFSFFDKPTAPSSPKPTNNNTASSNEGFSFLFKESANDKRNDDVPNFLKGLQDSGSEIANPPKSTSPMEIDNPNKRNTNDKDNIMLSPPTKKVKPNNSFVETEQTEVPPPQQLIITPSKEKTLLPLKETPNKVSTPPKFSLTPMKVAQTKDTNIVNKSHQEPSTPAKQQGLVLQPKNSTPTTTPRKIVTPSNSYTNNIVPNNVSPKSQLGSNTSISTPTNLQESSKLVQKYRNELGEVQNVEQQLDGVKQKDSELGHTMEEINEQMSEMTDSLKDLCIRMSLITNKLLLAQSPIMNEKIELMHMKYSHLFNNN
ncbi:hypothetical protein ABK040_006907 [Willaertia magna]